ncbi:MAG: ADP-ribosylation factor-like protein [Candidatus Helarchaeota archaeon]
MSKNEELITRKIVLMGLDNGGKTSILLSLQRNTNLMDYCSLKPTSGYNIQNFKDRGIMFSIWDFGGQEKYRETYLQNLDEYLAQVDKIIFVIDIQDIDRYQIALEYLKKIVEYLVSTNFEGGFSLFLHKFDPKLELLPDYSDETLSLRLYDKLKQIFPPDFRYEIFKTSIYTIFQKRSINLS